MIAYKEIKEELKTISLLFTSAETDDDLYLVHNKLKRLIDKIEERNKSQSGKVLEKRNSSNRAKRLHNVDNRLSYARKRNNEELVKKLEEEKEYIINNIFD